MKRIDLLADHQEGEDRCGAIQFFLNPAIAIVTGPAQKFTLTDRPTHHEYYFHNA